MDPLGFLGSLASGVMGMFGANKTAQNQQAIADENIREQNLYAQNRIQWTVADAKAAGINPLAALGNATQSYSNVVGPSDAGGGLTSMGQNVGRALAALSNKDAEADKLANDLTRAKIANVNADTVRQQAEASRQMTNNGQPGKVMLPTHVLVHAMEGDPRTSGTQPAFQDFRGRNNERITSLSPEFAATQFGVGAVPAGTAAGIGTVIENVKNAGESVIPPASYGRALGPQSSDYYYTPY